MATLTPMVSPSPLPALSPTLEPADTGWQVLQPGLERRMIHLFNDQNQHIESLYIFRLDQNLFRLDVAYRETPLNVEDWQKETNARMVVNGGFFREENELPIPNGLTIINGQAFGSSYDSFGGMLAINDQQAELRSLAQKPYYPGEPLWAGLQSFPLLVKPGGELGFPAESEDNVKARRTVIAQDKEGRIIFMIAPRGYFTLYQLSLYLTGSDLNLDIALNLDGGPSSGILLADPREVIPSQTLLPIVILVFAR
jgi:exopolysaccharide biosynthesis protein